ncbi:MAG: beta-N-acetylhexosaminidase [Pseudoxanthomonas sp.]
MKPSFSFRILAATLLAATLPLTACKPEAGHDAAHAPDAAAAPVKPALIPEPAVLQAGDGVFVVDADTRLHADSDAERRVAERFDDFLAAAKRPRLQSADGGTGGIRFTLTGDGGMAPEAYTLDVKPDGIVVGAANERGLFYGAVTLWQLLTQGDAAAVALPALHIADAPRFGWRGLMLDSARHFQSVDEIKRLLDQMALHKLNTFHWHLTDDQGWRIEIRKYPKLTETGSCRIPASADPASQPEPYCGFYTQAQIRDVVAYAGARHIDVVPEFDVPGHATAAIAAYPQLGVAGNPTPPVGNEWGVYPNLFNTEESTFAFFEDVFAEMFELFPGRYVHIGGDEAVKDQWIASPRVQQRMKELGAKDEMAMQGLLVARLEKYLSAHGKRLLGWDEILEGTLQDNMLPASATVMSWRGTEGGIAAANRGHDVVMSPSPILYFDHPLTDSPDDAPGQPGAITLQQVYDFEPVPASLPADKQAHILGLQANTWTEHRRSFARVQEIVFPRMAALAETGWSPAAKKDYQGFLSRLPAQLKRYQATGIAYAKTPFEPMPVPGATSRGNAQLDDCAGGLRWRLEDDGPRDGPRAIYAVNIFSPCLSWKQADLAGVDGIEVRVGRIPYNFQLAHDEPHRKFQPAKTAHGEWVVRAGCDGAELVNVPMPPQTDADGFVTLKAALPASHPQAADLCVYFTGDTRPAMWVLERMTLTK